MENTIKLNVECPGNELVVRQGAASPPTQFNPVTIDGDINAPAEFVAKRKDIIDGRTTNVVIDYEKAKIVLTTGENHEFRTIVYGTMIPNPALQSFKINSSAWESPKDLGEFLRRNRRYFSDQAEGAKIVSDLMTFKAKVEKEIEKTDDKRGNRRDLVEQKVTSSIPAAFDLQIPIFKNAETVKFRVELFFDIRDAGCRVHLDSIELIEATELQVRRHIDDQIPSFSDYVTIYR